MRRLLLFGGTIAALFLATPAMAIDIQLVPFQSGFSLPVFVTHANDGSGRVFVVEQTGAIKVLNSSGTVLGEFLNVSSLLFDDGGEQGLLGLAFHPQYSTPATPGFGKFYLNYSGTGGGAAGRTVVAEYTVSGNPNVANTAENRLLLISDPETNHNGGWISFGTDGLLYIAIGDGGDGGDPHGPIGNAQDTTALLGKMLRIDVNSDAFPGDPNRNYAIPPTNPFASSPGSEAKEIYAYGLRNPWRCSFDRANNFLYCGDVGQGAWEEVDIIVNGGNYGWRCREGNHDYNTSTPNCGTATFIPAIHEYVHNGVPEFDQVIIGGYVYRGSVYPSLQGLYFFADGNSGRIWTLDATCASNCPSVERRNAAFYISSFGEDQAGELYVGDLYGGVVYKLVDADFNASHFWALFE